MLGHPSWRPPADGYERRIGERRQGGRRSTDNGIDPIELKARETARQKLLSTKQQMQERIEDMLTAAPEKILALTQQLQRLRVSMLTLNEIVEGVADPNVYREMNLLNKMATGHDAEAEALKREQEQHDSEAQARLEGAGISSHSAAGMVRALESLRRVMEPADGDVDPASPGPAVN